jgi:glutaredoxin-like protein NrdH
MPAQSVKLYALSTCSHCKHTKELLDSLEVDYDCVDVDTLEGQERKDILEEVKKHNPRLAFPTLVVDGDCIVGFKEDEIRKAVS